jgi:hypothetical protein
MFCSLASYNSCNGAGGGVVTFGAPMILHSTDPATLYIHLAGLVEWAAALTSQQLCFHNIVQGMVRGRHRSF